ncbi:acetyltransferase, GNAT family [Entamoeba histolytica]
MVCQAWETDKYLPEYLVDSYCEEYCSYCYLHSNYCIVAEENEKVIGFLMGRDQSIFKKNNILEQKVKELKKQFHCYPESSILINSIEKYYEEAEKINQKSNKSIQNEVVLFIVNKEYRKKGIGKQLLNEFIKILQKTNQHDFYLITDTSCNYHLYDHLNYIQINSVFYPFKLSNCSLFCTMLSIWGAIFLVILCIFADSYTVKKGKMLKDDFDFLLLRINLGVAAGLYGLFVIGCGVWSVILIIKQVHSGNKVEYY